MFQLRWRRRSQVRFQTSRNKQPLQSHRFFKPRCELLEERTLLSFAQPPVSYPLNAVGPVASALGNFDGVNGLDIATANSSSGNVSIMLNTGAGTFGAPVNFKAGTHPTSIAVGDFDGDHIADLAVTNGLPGSSVSILLGNGDGTFKSAISVPTGPFPTAVAVGDFNGDGFADLAVTLQGAAVDIIMGNGNATFKPAVAYTGLGKTPVAIVTADFNGDTKPDIATANSGGANISILLNAGNGTFLAPLTSPVIASGANPWVPSQTDP